MNHLGLSREDVHRHGAVLATDKVGGAGVVGDPGAVRRDHGPSALGADTVRIAEDTAGVLAEQGDFPGLRVLDEHVLDAARGAGNQVAGRGAEGHVTAILGYGRLNGPAGTFVALFPEGAAGAGAHQGGGARGPGVGIELPGGGTQTQVVRQRLVDHLRAVGGDGGIAARGPGAIGFPAHQGRGVRHRVPQVDRRAGGKLRRQLRVTGKHHIAAIRGRVGRVAGTVLHRARAIDAHADGLVGQEVVPIDIRVAAVRVAACDQVRGVGLEHHRVAVGADFRVVAVAIGCGAVRSPTDADGGAALPIPHKDVGDAVGITGHQGVVHGRERHVAAIGGQRLLRQVGPPGGRNPGGAQAHHLEFGLLHSDNEGLGGRVARGVRHREGIHGRHGRVDRHGHATGDRGEARADAAGAIGEDRRELGAGPDGDGGLRRKKGRDGGRHTHGRGCRPPGRR